MMIAKRCSRNDWVVQLGSDGCPPPVVNLIYSIVIYSWFEFRMYPKPDKCFLASGQD